MSDRGTSGGIHDGDRRIDRPGRFRGIVSGTLTIAGGLDVGMAGIVSGGLIVEAGARVTVSGIVRGGIRNAGGTVEVTGLVAG